jgi:type IV fimbrial biogenesis protein FimT
MASPASGGFPSRRQSGVTLIELIVAISVLAILAALATPSFFDFRERSIAKGAAEEVQTHIANYRFEGVKRNRPVTVRFVGAPTTTAWCVGARQGNEPCDCGAATNTCDVGTFPTPGGGVDERRGARLVARSGFGATGQVTFDPSTGMLATLDQAGTFTIGSPSATANYQLQVQINAIGRTSLCVPAGAPVLPGYSSC